MPEIPGLPDDVAARQWVVARRLVEHEPGEVMEHLLLTPAEGLKVRARVETSAT